MVEGKCDTTRVTVKPILCSSLSQSQENPLCLWKDTSPGWEIICLSQTYFRQKCYQNNRAKDRTIGKNY